MADPQQTESSESSVHDFRSIVEENKNQPSEAKRFYTADKVYYKNGIWDVKDEKWQVDEKTNVKTWRYKLQLEDDNKVKWVSQGSISRLHSEGPNRPATFGAQ